MAYIIFTEKSTQNAEIISFKPEMTKKHPKIVIILTIFGLKIIILVEKLKKEAIYV